MRILIIAIGLLALSAQAEEGPDLWFTIIGPSFEVRDDTNTKTQVGLRFPEAEELSYYYVAQKFNTTLNENWSLGTHPFFEASKSGDDWNNTYRLDLELNPSKFTLGKYGPIISMRNRWEFLWKDGKGSQIFHRIRQLSSASWKLDMGPFTSYAIGNEIFFEEDKGKITMNRFYPITLGSNIGQQKIAYYLLYQSKRTGTSDDWNGRYIIGSTLSF